MRSKVILKSPAEIAIMRDGGKILAGILEDLAEATEPGISTIELDQIARTLCKKNNVHPSFLDVPGYNYAICTGINDIAVHGLPSENEIIKNGDIISIDIGGYYKGMHTDHAVTLEIGEVDLQASRLVQTTRLALKAAIKQAKVGNRVGDIGHAIESIARAAGFEPIVQMVGHGVGRQLHEAPEIPCVGKPGTGIVLEHNMTIAIEPMINEFGPDISVDKDGWTTRTTDGGRSAIFEHTVLVKDGEGEIMTRSNLF